MLHATDADHVVAVSNIVVRHRSIGSAARVGFFWGLGHTLTVFAVGSAIILFNLAISSRIEQAMEFCVALMLALLGIVTLSRVRREVHDVVGPSLAGGASVAGGGSVVGARLPLQPLHLHASGVRVYVHAHGPAGEHGWPWRPSGILRYPALRPLGIGVVHGLAGSAAVALLVLAQIHEPGWAVAYLLLFGVGTTAGMMLITSVLAIPFLRLGRWPLIGLGVQVLAGGLSLGLGCFLAYRLAATDVLFM
jgi:high-affinity nickel-transport protein